MNVGTIVTPNTKGQIVIPKKIRDDLNITKNTALNIVDDGKTIYIHPVKEVTTVSESNNSKLLKVLRETQGAWANADWDAYDKMEKRRRKIELAATKRNEPLPAASSGVSRKTGQVLSSVHPRSKLRGILAQNKKAW